MNDQKMTLKRPSGNEDEDDILKMQEEFLSSKNTPAAKVQRISKDPQVSTGALNAGRKPTKPPPDKDPPSDIVDFTDYTTDLPVLLAITERNVVPEYVKTPTKPGKAFPQAFKLENDPTPATGHEGGSRRTSLFAQQMKRKKAELKQSLQTPIESPMEVTNSSRVHSEEPKEDHSGSASTMTSMDIHDLQRENDARIAAMPLDEIKQYQEQLLKQLSPDVVNFIRSRGKILDGSTNLKKKNVEPTPPIDRPRETMDIDLENETEEESDIPTDLELPIAPEEAKKWVHMDKIEYDKLAWISSLPAAKPLDPNTGHTARFDFQGFLLAHDEEIPVQQGLHHHGEEPEVAGYTIEEMFHLSRSSLASQRIIALQTLAKVLHNSNLGLFDKCLNTKLMPQLLDAGIIFLLRMAVDESQIDAIGAAIYALHEMLVSELDEACLDMVFTWQNGHVAPFLICPKPSTKLTKEESEEMPDTEIVKDDVILGLLRMDLLPRLRYILEVMKPNDKTIIKYVFGILTRISRHSLQACSQLMNCPRLIKTVFDNFLVMHWSESGDDVNGAYGIPSSQALKLVRCLASAGRHLSKRLIQDFGLREILNAYIASESSVSSISLIRLEALRAWKVLLSYGLASETWLDLFPVLFNHYHHCQGLSLFRGGLTHDWHYTTLLLSSLQSLLYVAASTSKETESTAICWNHVANVFSLVSNLAQKWLQELTQFGLSEITLGINAVAAALNVLSTFLQLEAVQPNADTVKISESIHDIWSKSIQPLLRSTTFSHLTTNLGLNSSLLSPLSPGSNRNAPNLPFLGAAQFGGTNISPAVKEGSLMPLNVAIVIFTQLANRMHCLPEKSLNLVLHTYASYASSVVTCKHLRRTWFTREEVHLLHNLVQLVTVKITKAKDEENELSIYHKVALLLPSLTGPSESYLTEKLFKNVLFHPVFFSEEAKLSLQMMTLRAVAPPGLKSAAGDSVEASEGLILNHTFASLGAVRELYLGTVPSLPAIHKSRQILNSEFEHVQSLSVEYEVEKDTFSLDWPVSPLQTAYSQRYKTSSSESGGNPAYSVAKMRACLHWLHYLMLARSDFMKQSLEAGQLFVQLCSVFLISDDLFLSPEIQSVLHCAFRRFFVLHKCDQLQLEHLQKPVSFLTFYEELVNHYESTSYGDSLFAAVIWVPLQQKYSWLYKQIFLQEMTPALRRHLHSPHGHVLTLPFDQMLVPLEKYLYPVEEQTDMLQTYKKLLFSGALTSSPLFMAMAVHHLHHYVFSSKPDEKRKELLEQILQTHTLRQATPVLLYKTVDPTNGLQLYTDLPLERKEFLKDQGHSQLISKIEQVLCSIRAEPQDA